jgi:LacI family transcriptional regulator
LAIGALQEAKHRKLHVPEELSITGFDDMPMAAVVEPPLTTVRFPMAEVGVHAANYLLRALGEGDDDFETELQIRIVVRGSTLAPGEDGISGKCE